MGKPPARPDASDEATGLPPLDENDPRATMLAVAMAHGEGIATIPFTDDSTSVRFLSFRGLMPTGPDGSVEWAQIHVAVPSGDLDALRGALHD